MSDEDSIKVNRGELKRIGRMIEDAGVRLEKSSDSEASAAGTDLVEAGDELHRMAVEAEEVKEPHQIDVEGLEAVVRGQHETSDDDDEPKTPAVLSRLLVCTHCGLPHAPGWKSITPVTGDEIPEWIDPEYGTFWEAHSDCNSSDCDSRLFEEVYLPRRGREDHIGHGDKP